MDQSSRGGAELLPAGGSTSWWSQALVALRLLPPFIWVPLIAVLVMSLAVAGMSELSARRAHAANARIAQVLGRLEALADLRALIVDAETGQRGYLLTGDPLYLEPFSHAAEALPASLTRLRELCEGAPQVQTALAKASSLMAERLVAAANIVRVFDTSGSRAEAIAELRSKEGKQLMDALRAELATLEAVSRAELHGLQTERTSAARWSRARLLAMTVLSLVLLALLTRQFAVAALRNERRRHVAEREAVALEKLVAARTRELSELSTHLQEFSEKEKSELAHDLHDELGGLLTAAKMDLSWLQGRLEDPPTQQRLGQLGAALDEAMDVKRRVVEDLHPSLLDHFGLATALRAYLEGAARKASLQAEVTIDDALEVVPKQMAIALFRVVQEGFTNVVRHARARTVWVELAATPRAFRLVLRDDGSGFDATAPGFRWSHGIAGMRHRVRALGGNFAIDAAPGRGTTLRVEIPRVPAQRGVALEDTHFERPSATRGLSSAMSRILSRK